MLDKVRRYIELNKMLEKGESVVVGVSGGADSMCLLIMLIELGYDVKVVHINHMLRGKDADEDMVYVENFCKDRGIKCFSFSYDVEKIAKEYKLSCEEAGRKVRYEAFYQVMGETGSKKIAVAHNAGDNAETILHNLFRGTGLKGLVGINSKRQEIIRPILCLDREEIEEYLRKNNISYRSDATNFENIYTRNKIRNELIPYAKENINSNAANHVNTTGHMLGEIDDFISAEGDKIYRNIVNSVEGAVQISTLEFDSLHIVMKKYIIRKAVSEISSSLKDITYTHVESILELFGNNVGKSVNLPYNILAKKTYDGVKIYKELDNISIVQNNVYIKIRNFGEFSLGQNGKKLIISPFSKEQWKLLENKYEEIIYTKWLDCDILNRNLVIRTRKPGDYIVVDNKGSRKKLKDLFIDLKIPKDERDKVLLLADGDEILWVIGHRINYNYRVTENTEEIMMLEYVDE